ncbi:MAG TPA: tetratricopeptide repeat protein, partial [Aestuariivirga sp.]|nr:tetratricopeptide repeat protein [Aestuariivirga sp.]
MRYALSLILLLAAGTPVLAAATFEEAVALFEDKEFKSAREIAEPLAKGGDARAMAMMGALYQLGNGVKPDLEKAVSWYTRAAEKNHPGAQFSLAMLYLDGSLGNPDADKGALWLEKAATGGNPQAQY